MLQKYDIFTDYKDHSDDAHNFRLILQHQAA